MNLPEGMPIKDVSFEQLQQVRGHIHGWVYPKRNVSQFASTFTAGQQAAMGFYGFAAIGSIISGLILPFILGSWWWMALVPVAIILWKANRKSMEQFFLENLQSDRAFYDAVRATEMGSMVKVVLRRT